MPIDLPQGVIDPNYRQGDTWAAAVIGQQVIVTESKIVNASPIDGQALGMVSMAPPEAVDQALAAAQKAQVFWRTMPAPQRGELVAEIGRQARAAKADLAAVISADVGKTTQEALGEVQEWIDMCDFAVGLSRQLYGLTIASERPGHRLMEQWHPLGTIGVISAFNFPMAVWAWNSMLSFVCGNTVVWKTSEKSPLCGLACHTIVQRALAHFISQQENPADYQVLASGLHSVIVGDAAVGEAMAANPGFPLVSATGSTRMGRAVAQTVAARLGRSLLELGGNNAAIISPNADLKLAIPAVVFSAVGTTGQRCTTLRRLFVHRSLHDKVVETLVKAYATVSVGDPRLETTHVGPLIDKAAMEAMQSALARAQAEGGELLAGGQEVTPEAQTGGKLGGAYVAPALVKMPEQSAVVCEETFAPILYVMPYDTLDEAIALNNAVPQGLSSAIFTESMREAETFVSPTGSDCGIVNVNVGTSGAEIGGAFGGEKETGGGRESGSDAWKAYMRRATNTINYSDALPLAQGVKFDIQ